MIAALLTRYILASVWTRILIFIIFYFILRELHFIDLDFSAADCMMNTIDTKAEPKNNNEYFELLKTVLLNKQEQIQTEMQHSILEAEIRATSNFNSQILEIKDDQKMIREGVQRAFSEIKNEQKLAKNEFSTLKEKFKQQSAHLQAETKNSLVGVNNRIEELDQQNQELQKTVIEQVAEAKNQQNLIENVRKSFERKLNARDLLINQLQEDKTQLVRNVTDLQQKNEQLANHVNRLERTFDRDIQSLHRAVDRLLSERNTAKIDDIHTMGLPPSSSKPF